MPSGDAPPEAEIDKLNEQINDGLKTCRSMMNDYRAVLSSTGAQTPSVEVSDGSDSLVGNWRTQEDSNL